MSILRRPTLAVACILFAALAPSACAGWRSRVAPGAQLAGDLVCIARGNHDPVCVRAEMAAAAVSALVSEPAPVVCAPVASSSAR
jgi:predicted esterase